MLLAAASFEVVENNPLREDWSMSAFAFCPISPLGDIGIAHGTKDGTKD